MMFSDLPVSLKIESDLDRK